MLAGLPVHLYVKELGIGLYAVYWVAGNCTTALLYAHAEVGHAKLACCVVIDAAQIPSPD